MPHIFPRRFLRTRDILTPKELNDDIHPVSDLISGRLDSTNFNSGSLSSRLKRHPDDTDTAMPTFDASDSWRPGACVAEGAYFNIYDNSVESRYQFYPHEGSKRRPPNFVELDGTTFRAGPIRDGSSNPNSKPFVVPNHGGWVAVKNADLSSNQQLNFTTGKSKLWISAYAQYIWQGFYEEKPPYITKNRKYRDLPALQELLPDVDEDFLSLDDPTSDGANNRKTLTLREREVLNRVGPSRSYEYLPTASTKNTTEALFDSDASFGFPLNEYGPVEDRVSPSRGGYHHISRGGTPCLVQFALRVDGKIIEETITGKALNNEESSHGLSVTDSIRKRDEDETEGEVADIASALPGFTERYYVFGQRSIASSSSYGDRSDSRPGQKVRSSRSVGYGPEVMPVRLGAVIDVEPGDHTVELCVRRLERKKGKYRPGDYVGVFSRRLLTFDLPIETKRQESAEIIINSFPGSDSGSETLTQQPKIESFKSETVLTNENISRPRRILRAQTNDINTNYLDDNVFSHHFLPSKVMYNQTATIKPGYRTNKYTGEATTKLTSTTNGTDAIFGGFLNTSKLNRVVTDPNAGWSSVTNHNPATLGTVEKAGWFQLKDIDGSTLSITPSETVLRPHEKLILMMDVELLGIEPLYSDESIELMDMMKRHTIGSGEGGAADIREAFAHYAHYLLAERYLDLFALFAIGYKQGSNWTIASESVPAVVNSFNWVNRTAGYHASSDACLPIALRLLKENYLWDINPFWERVSGPGIAEFTYRTDSELEAYKEWVDSITWIDGRGLKDNMEDDDTFGSGGRLARSNLGINVPIMQVISNDTSSDMTFNEFGGFTASVVMSDVTFGHHYNNKRTYVRDDGEEFAVRHGWASPIGGRKILKGARVHYGNSKLSAIKVKK